MVYGLGIFVTLVWLAVNYRQLRHTDKLIGNKLGECVPLWLEVDRLRPKVPLGIQKMTGYLLPAGLVIAWVVLWFV